MYIASGRADRTWVIRCEERQAGFSANARSEIYSCGTISVTPLVLAWCVGEKGLADGRGAT